MRIIVAIAMAIWTVSGGLALADGDASSGEKIFSKCKSCHMVGENAKTRIGPSLNGIVDRHWGGIEGFNYSPALKELAATGRVWDETTLDAYLKKPKDVIPRGRMVFPGLVQPEQRADIIAYLRQFDANGVMAK